MPGNLETGVARAHFQICQVEEEVNVVCRIEDLDLVVLSAMRVLKPAVRGVVIHFHKMTVKSETLETGNAKVHFRHFLNKSDRLAREREAVQGQTMAQEQKDLETASHLRQHGVKEDLKVLKTVRVHHDVNFRNVQLSRELQLPQSRTISGARR